MHPQDKLNELIEDLGRIGEAYEDGQSFIEKYGDDRIVNKYSKEIFLAHLNRFHKIEGHLKTMKNIMVFLLLCDLIVAGTYIYLYYWN
jgi:hypothetical protein